MKLQGSKMAQLQCYECHKGPDSIKSKPFKVALAHRATSEKEGVVMKCPTHKGITEKAFSQQIVDLAHHLGYKVHRNWSELHSPKGWPDLVLCKSLPPRLIFIELKSEKGKLSEEQEEWLNLLRQVPGVETYLFRPSQFNFIVATLEVA